MQTKPNREKNNYFIYDLGVLKRTGPDFIKNVLQKYSATKFSIKNLNSKRCFTPIYV